MAGAESVGAELSPGREAALYFSDYPAWVRYIAPLRLALMRRADPKRAARSWWACGVALKAEILRIATPEDKQRLWAATTEEEREALRRLALDRRETADA